MLCRSSWRIASDICPRHVDNTPRTLCNLQVQKLYHMSVPFKWNSQKKVFIYLCHSMMSQMSIFHKYLSWCDKYWYVTNICYVFHDVTNPIRVVNRRQHLQFGHSTIPGIIKLISLKHLILGIEIPNHFEDLMIWGW